MDTGTYVVSGVDANGCSINALSYTITSPDSLILAVTTTDSDCDQPTASINAAANGGTSLLDYTYYILNSSSSSFILIVVIPMIFLLILLGCL